MRFVAGPLEGLFVIELQPFRDVRGFFARTFCAHEFADAGLVTEWVQINHSMNALRGTLRGLHYQHPPYAEVKLVRCIRGSVLDVVVDIRRQSPTFLKAFQVELSASNQKMLYIPAGFAHGFQTLEDGAELIYQHSNFYHPEAEAGIHYADPTLKIQWPLTPTNVSEKDKLLTFIDRSFSGIAVN